MEIDGSLDELERRAAGGALDHHILKARIRSEDPIPDLAASWLRPRWCPSCSGRLWPALPSRDGHVGGDPAPAAIDECVEAARHREQVPTGRVRKRTRLHQSLREAARETDALAQQRATEVEEPLAASLRDLNRERDLMARSAGDLGRDLELPDALIAADPQAAATLKETARGLESPHD